MVFILQCLLLCYTFAQPRKPRFEHLTTNNGLTNNGISHIYQDKRGFIWISTRNGLNRYDGKVFKNFEYIPGEINSLSDNEINYVIEDSKGRFWIATQDGLNILNPVSERINHFALNDLLSSNELTTVAEDKFGNIWIGTRKGLDRFNLTKNEITVFKNDPADKKSLSNNVIKTIYSDRNGNLWIGTAKGLCRFNHQSNNFRVFLNDSLNTNSIVSNVISYISEDRNGNLWVGTINGLSKVIQKDDEINFENYFFDDGIDSKKKLNRIRVFDDDSKGNLWIGTIGGGLVIFNPSTHKFFNYQSSENDNSSISDNEIFAVCVDNFDNLWIGSSERGISKFSQTKTRFELFKPDPFAVKEVPVNDITSVYSDEENKLWLGTNGNGVLVYKLDENYYPVNLLFELKKNENGGLSSNYITSILKDKDGYYWIGTIAGGLNKFNPVTKKVTVFKNIREDVSSLSNNYVNSVFEDSDGNIWIATSAGGVNKYDKKSDSFTRYTYEPGKSTKSLNSPEVTSIYQDSKGNLWFGTTTGGLNKFDRNTETFTYYTYSKQDRGTISSRKILCAYEDRKGRLWVGTFGGGVNLFSNDSFVHFSVKEGLSSNIIFAITEDNAGNLWLSTDKGVSRLNPDSKEIKNFDESDGLQGKEFNPGAAAKHPKSGTIYFGGTRGLNIYNRRSISTVLTPPPVFITDFKIFNQSLVPGNDFPIQNSISFVKEITLSYDQNIISFSFASMDFTSPSKNQYAYKLEGFNDDWIYSGNISEVTYTNLASGDYIFKVKASNSDGVWNETGAEIKLIINPPFWQTWWAVLFYTIVVVVGLLGIRHFEKNRIKLRNELRMHEFEAKKQRELETMKSRFYANLSHEFRTPLMLIKGPAEQLIKQMPGEKLQEQLKMIERNADYLHQLIDQLLELSQLEAASISLRAKEENLVNILKGITFSFDSLAKQKNISLNFLSDNENLIALIDRDKLEKIMNNLLSNAFKFTDDGGTVEVKLKTSKINEQEFAEVIISDTGIGIAEDKHNKIFDRFYQADDSPNKKYSGSGIGLALVKELVELHKWSISVSSKEKEGTKFTLRIPLYDYLTENAKAGEQIPQEEQTVTAKKYYENIHTNKNKYSEKAEQSFEGKPTILIVEDSADVRKYLIDLLKESYILLEAKDGDEGIETARNNSVDLIISDVMMPKMDGMEFGRIIKSNWQTSHIPIILLTAKVGKESKLEGLEIGADDYLTKPFETKELFIRIKNLLEQRRRLREKFSKEIRISAEAVTTNSVDNEFLAKALLAADKNLGNADYTAEDFAKEMFVSLSQLRRKLIAITGQTPGEFLRTYRLKRAAQLILENKLSITQIAFEVGFNSPSHFTKAFKQELNCLPTEFTGKANNNPSPLA